MAKASKNISLVENVNQHILNVITPSGIDFGKYSASLGDNEGEIYFIAKYPTDGVDYGWLSDICNLPGTSTQVELKFADPYILINAFNKQISEKKSSMSIAKEESERQTYQKQIDDLEKMINRISVKNEPVAYMAIILFIQARTQEKLQEREKKVKSILATSKCNIRPLKYRQPQALKAIAPYGLPSDDVKKMANRNIPLSTFTGGFPMSDSGIMDPGGYYLGKTENGRLVFLNQWLRNKDRVNSNWFISGLPGVGKSTFLKKVVMSENAFRTKVIMMDPEREYQDIANDPDINGDIVDCGGGVSGRINPLQIRPLPIVKKEDLQPGEFMSDFMEFEENVSPMALHIQFLRNFFKLYFGKEEYTAAIKSQLEECLIQTYNKHDIFWETDVSKLKAEDFPYMEHLYETVGEELQLKGLTEYKRTNLEKLRDLLRSAAIGADKYLWNGPTTIKADSKFVVLDTFGLHDLDDNVKNAQNLNIAGWAWQQMSADRTTKILFGVDEGYLCVDPDYPDLMKFLRNISKRDRKYECGLMFITHSVVDILDPAVKRFGQAIIDNACYKFIMGCDGKNLQETASLFNFSPKEITFLAAKNRGAGILFAGNVRQAVNIKVHPKFLQKMGTAGGR